MPIISGSPEELSAPSTDNDPFDYLSTVDAVRIQFMGEHEDTRIAALKWLIMLHQKIPKKVHVVDTGRSRADRDV